MLKDTFIKKKIKEGRKNYVFHLIRNSSQNPRTIKNTFSHKKTKFKKMHSSLLFLPLSSHDIYICIKFLLFNFGEKSHNLHK